jgi:hypothetical protein
VRTYKSPAAFRSALEDHLRRKTREAGIPQDRMWALFSFDRLLARLLTEDFVLKGGYAMELRIRRARATKDVDLALPAADSNEAILARLQALAAKELGDHVVCVIGEPTMDIDVAPYGGARFPVEARIAGQRVAAFHLDVGVGDAASGAVEEVEGRDWLDFAGIARPRFRLISKEQQFAEKLHAYTLPRTSNSRVKDLVDLVLLLDLGLDEAMLPAALRATFERRKTHVLPDPIPDAPADWAKPFAKLAGDCGLSLDARAAIAKVRGALARRPGR